jgi:hypothetical protein
VQHRGLALFHHHLLAPAQVDEVAHQLVRQGGHVVLALAEGVAGQQQAAQHPVHVFAVHVQAGGAALVAHALAGVVQLEGRLRHVVRHGLQQAAEAGGRDQRHAGVVVHLAGQRQQVGVAAPAVGHGRHRRPGLQALVVGVHARLVQHMATRVAPVQHQAVQRQGLDEAAEAALALPVAGQPGVLTQDDGGQPRHGHRLVSAGHLGTDALGHRVQRRGQGLGALRPGHRLGRLSGARRLGQGRRRGQQSLAGGLVVLAATQGVAHEVVLVDQQVGRGAVGSRGEAHRQHRGAAIPAAQLAQHGGEVGVGGEDDELVVVHLVLQQVHHVQHHVDVGAGLAFAGHGRAVDDLEAGVVEGGAVALVDLRVQVHAAHQQAAAGALGRMLGRGQVAQQPFHPAQRLAGKAVGKGRVQLAQAGIDVVEVNKECAFHGSSGPDCLCWPGACAGELQPVAVVPHRACAGGASGFGWFCGLIRGSAFFPPRQRSQTWATRSSPKPTAKPPRVLSPRWAWPSPPRMARRSAWSAARTPAARRTPASAPSRVAESGHEQS